MSVRKPRIRRMRIAVGFLYVMVMEYPERAADGRCTATEALSSVQLIQQLVVLLVQMPLQLKRYTLPLLQ